MEIVNLGEGDGLPPVNWTDVVEKLDRRLDPAPEAHNAHTTWLSTINKDGSPHVTAVGALWLDGSFWFQTGYWYAEESQRRPRPALFDRGVGARRRRCCRR